MSSTKFLVCIPDYVNGLIWCQHFNGNWAPPFPMRDWQGYKPNPLNAKDSPKEDESDA